MRAYPSVNFCMKLRFFLIPGKLYSQPFRHTMRLPPNFDIYVIEITYFSFIGYLETSVRLFNCALFNLSRNIRYVIMEKPFRLANNLVTYSP